MQPWLVQPGSRSTFRQQVELRRNKNSGNHFKSCKSHAFYLFIKSCRLFIYIYLPIKTVIIPPVKLRKTLSTKLFIYLSSLQCLGLVSSEASQEKGRKRLSNCSRILYFKFRWVTADVPAAAAAVVVFLNEWLWCSGIQRYPLLSEKWLISVCLCIYRLYMLWYQVKSSILYCQPSPLLSF